MIYNLLSLIDSFRNLIFVHCFSTFIYSNFSSLVNIAVQFIYTVIFLFFDVLSCHLSIACILDSCRRHTAPVSTDRTGYHTRCRIVFGKILRHPFHVTPVPSFDLLVSRDSAQPQTVIIASRKLQISLSLFMLLK